MFQMNRLKFLLGIGFSVVICWCLSTISVSAKPMTLGKYPVCEPSAAVKVTCPESGKRCLLVGDNEENKDLFLYPVSSKRLKSKDQSELALEKKISDIEAIAKLDDNKVLIFGSHSRNSKCKVKPNRQRFLQAKVLNDRLETIGEPSQSPQIDSKVLFNGLDIDNNKILRAVSRAIDDGETAANQAEGDKTTCQEANAFNAEGAVTFANSSSKPRVWIGLRSPLVSLESKDYAILLQMARLDNYQFDGAALVDLAGRGIRELTFNNNWIWGIAGGPKDGQDNFVLWKLSAESLKPNAVLKPEIVRELPPSSEGLAIVDETAYVLIDGDSGDSGKQCKIPGTFVQFSVPD